MGLRVVRPGLSTTVQDLGRSGYRNFGVPVGGAFDRGSLDLANALLGNELDAAALEFTLVGGRYRAESTLAIALAGAPMSAVIRSETGPDRSLAIPGSATLRMGEELDVGGTPRGARTYLAVRGGWHTPVILGSRSSEVRLEPGQLLLARSGSTSIRRPVDWPWPVVERAGPIRIVDGPDAVGEVGAGRLCHDEFVVANQCDRMGLRMEGRRISVPVEADRVSSPVAPGAIQVAGGRPIVLGVAGGTMGGYFHLAHVASVDLDRLGQLRPGEVVRFLRIEVEEARRLAREQRANRARWLEILRAGTEGLGPG